VGGLIGLSLIGVTIYVKKMKKLHNRKIIANTKFNDAIDPELFELKEAKVKNIDLEGQ